MGRRACFRFCRVAFGQDNETRPALNTPSPEAQCARDRGDAFASLIKNLDFSKSGKLRSTGRSLCKMPMRALGNSLGTGFFRSAVAASPYRPARINQLPFYRLPKVLQQVETVGNLPRLRGSYACALGIESGAVAADHFDLRMPFEPLGGGSGRTVW